MEWYKIKEKSAGKKRLLLTWYLYKILGTKVALLIAFFVAIVTLLANKDIKKFSHEYFETLYNYTNDKTFKPTFCNSFRHVFSYAESLVYKMEAFAGTFNNKKIAFADKEAKENLFAQINRKEGVLFLCNHVGNVDMMKSFLADNSIVQPSSVTIFLQKEHCTTFNQFINSVAKKHDNLKVYPIEEIDLSTVAQLDDDLNNGGIAFIAGDRIAANNPDRVVELELLGRKINLPQGSFRLAKILDSHVYFVSCLKSKNGYDIFLEEQLDKNNDTIMRNYLLFLEKMIKKAPWQFYHFYTFFK